MTREAARTPISFHFDNVKLMVSFHVFKGRVNIAVFVRAEETSTLFVLFRDPITPVRISFLIFVFIASSRVASYVSHSQKLR